MPLTPLKKWIAEWKDCTRCPLHKTRTQVVHARGNVPADRLDLVEVLFVGDAPGDSEDAVGQPFAGPAGFVLDDIIKQALPVDVRYAVANLVGCVPRDEDGHKSGQPDHDEIMACRPRLETFINLCRLELVVAVGKLPEEYAEQGVATSIRFGRPIPVVSIIHPAAICRMPYMGRGLAVRKCVVTVAKAVETNITRKGVR